MNLLTVDWDFFFPVPHDDPARWVTFFDWGTSEARSPEFADILWVSRAQGFMMSGEPLPQVAGWERFAERFKLADGCQLLYSNSHVYGACDEYGDVRDPDEIRVVWLFDAHHDSGYGSSGGDRITCEDWLGYYTVNGAETHVRYPKWHTLWDEVDKEPAVPPTSRMLDDGTAPDVEFDVVQVCRSDAWVPPWCDDAFQEFLDTWDDCEERYEQDETFRDLRPFDIVGVAAEAELRKQAYEMARLRYAQQRGT